MAAKKATIKIGETDYVVPQLNVGQLEKVSEILDGTMQVKLATAFKVFPIIMERASPPIPNPNEVEATVEEIMTAMNAVLDMSGLLKKKEITPSQPTADQSPEAKAPEGS